MFDNLKEDNYMSAVLGYFFRLLLIISILVWYAIHLFAEGYIMASGDFSFLHIWMLIALANVIVSNKYKIKQRVI